MQTKYEAVRLTDQERYAAEELALYHGEHPLALRAANWAQNTSTNSITQTWQVLGFRHCVISRLFSLRYNTAEGPQEAKDAYNVILAFNIKNAHTYLWDRELLRTIYETPLPTHVVDKNILPYDKVWFTFNSPVELKYPGDEYTTLCAWMYLEKTSDGIMFICESISGPDSTPTYTMLGSNMEYGKQWPDDYQQNNSEEELLAIGQILRMMAFANSDYVSTTPERIARNERKSITRAPQYGPNDDDHTTTVRFVQLRPEVHAALTQYNHDMRTGHTPVGYWWVRGHNRAQWYPSRQAHQTKWIAPYRKGNLTGTIIDKIYKVAR